MNPMNPSNPVRVSILWWSLFLFLLLSLSIPTLSTWAKSKSLPLPPKKQVSTEPEFISPKPGELDPLHKTKPNQINDFVGLVQFKKGSVRWSATQRKDPLQFKTSFQWNESIHLEDNSYVKIITRNRCIGVVYGRSQLLTPLPSVESYWNVLGGSVRWICDKEKNENLHIDGHALTLKDAEIVYHHQQLYVIRGRVLSESGELKPGITYEWQSNHHLNQWEQKWGSEDTYSSWSLNQQLPHPKESLQIEQPLRNIHSRWSLGVLVGSINFKHPNSQFSLGDKTKNHGARLQGQFKSKEQDQDLLTSLSFYQAEPENQHFPDFSSSQTPITQDYLNNRLESFFLEVGLRTRHQSAWSWMFRGGLGHDSLKIDSFGSNYSHHRELSFLSSRLSFGVDYLLMTSPNSLGGVLLSAEVYFHQSLKYLDAKINNGDQTSDNNGNWRIDRIDLPHQQSAYHAWGIMLHLAPLLQF